MVVVTINRQQLSAATDMRGASTMRHVTSIGLDAHARSITAVALNLNIHL